MSNTTQPKGQPFELVPITIEAKGEVISSNLPEFREMVREALATINRDPKTDEEFGQAEKDTKALKTAESSVQQAKEDALQQSEDLKALFDALDETSEEVRAARLELEKRIKDKKAEIKTALIDEALNWIDSRLPAMKAEAQYRPKLEECIKGKRTLDSMRTVLKTTTTGINGTIHASRKILDEFAQGYGEDMIRDRAELETRRPQEVDTELQRRIDLKAAEEAKRKAEAEAKEARAETEATRKEAEEAVKPAPLPDPPKVGSIPTGPSEKAELDAFKARAIKVFSELKQAKEDLRHPANKARAEVFAKGVNAAWKEAMKEQDDA